MLIDCGANVECTSEYLLQFAYMGSFYAKKLMGCENPRVGLLNVGTEDTKGGELQHQTFALLKQAHEEGRINFIGNVEGTGVFNGSADVIVTDGFTGNVLLKGTEGVIKYMMKALKGVFYSSTKNKLAALVLKKDLAAMKKSMDVNEVGGTALVGISKPVIKAHGSSNEASFFAAIRQAVAFVQSGIIDEIKENIDYLYHRKRKREYRYTVDQDWIIEEWKALNPDINDLRFVQEKAYPEDEINPAAYIDIQKKVERFKNTHQRMIDEEYGTNQSKQD